MSKLKQWLKRTWHSILDAIRRVDEGGDINDRI